METDKSKTQIFKRLTHKKDLLALPQVLSEVIRVTNREDYSTKELAGVILKDPSLTAQLLRIVNSSLYSPSKKVSTINQAVIALGTRVIKALVLSTSLYRMFDKDGTVVDCIRFWRHSLETAIACREIAKICNYKPDEEAFVAGLVHDLGILMLVSNYPQQYEQIVKRAKSEDHLIKMEEDVFGIHHALAGKMLVDEWKLPEIMGNAILCHHDSVSADRLPAKDMLGHIVNLGDKISKYRVFQLPGIETNQLKNIGRLLSSFRISASVLAGLQEKVFDMLVQESEFLEIKVGSMTDLLKEANKLMFKQYMVLEMLLRKNKKMQEQITKERMKKAKLESLKTVTGTLSHYINNALTTIMARAELVETAVSDGRIIDSKHVAEKSIKAISKSADKISLILNELMKISSFDVTQYFGELSILDIEHQIQSKISPVK